ncbi:glycosyltransferase [Mucilaginibacter phyllosphaerae]|uniref:Glycosyltransferase involved in cell wall biosynthesis n=1 Tax=Mucilaginibacter phyllosphaerae TaxID=1812349 RepID=A0A4Y8AF18_9SPHI|nr:glycosyltransferase [Mucilaginibacter phyllosphaerae]MBB3969037.1 glycosyltransferase involved in cell wall biosynthesis [Mucilaginibacter phyllosphaerae]TEW67350.1 hypothetical protein E2R65_04995 [Mucilaginibacter phyllosphaerae]GGH23626.1 hypothetical protein GCM10007352_37630 [Mucilaginibacter phyllosphaerae]
MISVIICSANPGYLENVTRNISDTIGVPYELIAINNAGTNKGISQVYNEGISRAKYQVLCFMHEDVIIKTLNWGNTLLNLFKDEQLGLVGVAGAGYVPISPSAGGGVNSQSVYMNILQSFKFSAKGTVHDYENPEDERLSEVAVLDGVFISTTKKVVAEFTFDEVTCSGFHAYDIDFSLAVGTRYKNAVTYDILLHHLSEGNYDSRWMLDNMKVFNKWNHRLPLNIKNISAAKSYKIEKATFKRFTDQLMEFNLPVNLAFTTLFKNNTFWNYNKGLFLKLSFYALKKKLSAKKA